MTTTAIKRIRRLRGRRLALFGLGLMLMACASVPPAEAQSSSRGEARREHEVTWGHPNPDNVARFFILASPTGEPNGARRINVGKPNGVAEPGLTVFSVRAELADDELIAVIAVGRDSRSSEPSAWSGVRPTQPGQPLVVDP